MEPEEDPLPLSLPRERTPTKAAEKHERARHAGRSWGPHAMERFHRTVMEELTAFVILR